MNVEEYLKQGETWHRQGRYTDGCSFFGFLMNKKYIKACWSHDFARAGLIDLDDDDESTNDYMFRKALRHLGMSDWLSTVIYGLTRTQGFIRDKTGLPASSLVSLLFFLSIVGGIWWYESSKIKTDDVSEVNTEAVVSDKDTNNKIVD